ncbi:MAG: ATP synthase F1 subunit epsilon [Pirellulales bacterium]|nr:ATP synthase F1 subunit epsilon [Pirellulales bacterium]
MQCIIVTPERTLRDQPADFIVVTLEDGEIGIASGHAPLLGRLGYGEMRVSQAGKTERFYVEGGFLEVLENVVTVLTPRAAPAEQIDPAVAREQLFSALSKPAPSGELLAVRNRAVAISRARLRVARRTQP